ncbi:MAG: helix-turn-helix domain-containing protein [Caulobacteraceae bacterium]|nr:helix-turn-helix domain-containing protein [Caulobacteraceae bacterium]
MQRSWVSSPDYRAVVETLRTARTEKGLSQREVARRLGKHVSFLNKIELIERRIDVLEFVMLCRALEIDPHGLLERIVGALSEQPDF